MKLRLEDEARTPFVLFGLSPGVRTSRTEAQCHQQDAVQILSFAHVVECMRRLTFSGRQSEARAVVLGFFCFFIGLLLK